MALTRSKSGSLASAATKRTASSQSQTTTPPPLKKPRKSKSLPTSTSSKSNSKPSSSKSSSFTPAGNSNNNNLKTGDDDDEDKTIVTLLTKDIKHSVPVPILFDFAKARDHLIEADNRFKPLFDTLKCRPFEDIKEEDSLVNPFQSLSSSILGQQVSWLAARAIRYRFIRLFYPELPEQVPESSSDLPFPTPQQVIKLDISQLRAAGLSTRKAEYILELAQRFSDGRLDAETLVKFTDEELIEELVAIRGIGKWTVEMFSIFTLRRPDILPAGDLGIQKGLLRWYTQENPCILPKKLPGHNSTSPKKKGKNDDNNISSPPETPKKRTNGNDPDVAMTPSTTLPETPKKQIANGQDELPETPLTPSIKQRIPLPDGCSLTHSTLKARLKKPIKNGLYLTPTEMDELTKPWAPYRSVGIWYLWSLADGNDA